MLIHFRQLQASARLACAILQSEIPVPALIDTPFVQLLQNRLSEGARKGEEGVLLDGFPRTRNQAEALLTFADVQLALNLSLREEVLFCPPCCACMCCSRLCCIPHVVHMWTDEGRQIVEHSDFQQLGSRSVLRNS